MEIARLLKLPEHDVQEQENISPDEPVETSDADLAPDDGTKPPYSYATLIGMAILRNPARKLTLSAIYAWISDTFSYYSNTDSGWQDSIRHNLSLNKNFESEVLINESGRRITDQSV